MGACAFQVAGMKRPENRREEPRGLPELVNSQLLKAYCERSKLKIIGWSCGGGLEQSEIPCPFTNPLITRYSEAHRAYHNLVYIQKCLQEFEGARSLAEDADAVEMAIWFHDAVYDPKATDNEELSGQLAAYLLDAAAMPEAFSQKVARLILATNHDAPPENKDAALLIDVDLSILGQPREIFAEYEAAIRQEYAEVPKEGNSRVSTDRGY